MMYVKSIDILISESKFGTARIYQKEITPLLDLGIPPSLPTPFPISY